MSVLNEINKINTTVQLVLVMEDLEFEGSSVWGGTVSHSLCECWGYNARKYFGEISVQVAYL